MGQEQERCKVCDRVDCPTLELPPIKLSDSGYSEPRERFMADAFCRAHAVDWRRRALEAEARERWVPVGEQLPTAWEPLAVRLDNGCISAAIRFVGVVGSWDVLGWGNLPVNKVTHWRPMPAAPEVP